MVPQWPLRSCYSNGATLAGFSSIREPQLTNSAVFAPWELRHPLCGFLRWVWESFYPFSLGSLLTLQSAEGYAN